MQLFHQLYAIAAVFLGHHQGFVGAGKQANQGIIRAHLGDREMLMGGSASPLGNTTRDS